MDSGRLFSPKGSDDLDYQWADKICKPFQHAGEMRESTNAPSSALVVSSSAPPPPFNGRKIGGAKDFLTFSSGGGGVGPKFDIGQYVKVQVFSDGSLPTMVTATIVDRTLRQSIPSDSTLATRQWQYRLRGTERSIDGGTWFGESMLMPG
ncbi:hypothetical protein N0V90_005638 [Kalmusia sp. IMI 367209]|nr:hypothetical protein N0V90_005638 [Kalmusia sp. IMI 367209]